MNAIANFPLHHRNPAGGRQRGIALVVGLVILVILALLGTTAYSVATQEERMAGNARDHARAFQAAEFALRECEKIVATGPTFVPVATAANGAGMLAAPTTGQWTGDAPLPTWQSLSLALPTLNGNNTPPPLCIAEDFQRGAKIKPGTVKNLIPHTARVTAVGQGITTGAKVTLVSYVNYFTTN